MSTALGGEKCRGSPACFPRRPQPCLTNLDRQVEKGCQHLDSTRNLANRLPVHPFTPRPKFVRDWTRWQK
jgi:hypothetical protein